MKKIKKSYTLAVVGGGLSGMCAAIAAARHGVKTALIHNRPVLGGNASSEIRMHICGADKHGTRENSRETGIVEELQIINKYRNSTHSWSIFDTIMWESCAFTENLDLYLNTHMTAAHADDTIKSITAVQLTTETEFEFYADMFVDTTGDGTLGAMAGAQYMYGREDKTRFGEPHGQQTADGCTMGNSLMFTARDCGKRVDFIKPEWAYTFTEQQLANRAHHDITSGYWWIELGGKTLNVTDDYEKLRDELLKTVYGVWDHIKNSENSHGAENYELDWVGMLPGKRESRRLVGEYVLNENDLLCGRRFDDAIAYGGWDMDCHVIEGLLSHESKPTEYIHLPDVYTIPYRCVISKNIGNLFLGGRAISASHLAFASTRVMATCGVIGQAIGTAASLCAEKQIGIKQLCNHITELQQRLLRDDCYIPGAVNTDDADMAKTAAVTASSAKEGADAAKIINGVSRNEKGTQNCYISDGIATDGERVSFSLGAAKAVGSVEIKFDSNLSRQLTISINKQVQNSEESLLPSTLVKDFDIVFTRGGKEVKRTAVRNNYRRFYVLPLSERVECDTVTIEAYSTYGDENIRIFEVRIY